MYFFCNKLTDVYRPFSNMIGQHKIKRERERKKDIDKIEKELFKESGSCIF